MVASMPASAINFAVARSLLQAGKQYRSITLEADAHRLRSDVWTSAGIHWESFGVLHRMESSGSDHRDRRCREHRSHRSPAAASLRARANGPIASRGGAGRDQPSVESIRARGNRYHALRTRCAGARSFISLHVLVPGDWSVQRGHDALEEIERDIRAAIPGSSVFTHLEPIDDPAAWQDSALDRAENEIGAKRS